jgi:hypothetical protein
MVLLGAWLAPRADAQMTEVPQVVEPGKVLLEMDWLALHRDRPDDMGTRYRGTAVASTLISVGVAPAVDAQLAFDFHFRDKVTAGGTTEVTSGRGDVSLRMKWAFWAPENSPLAVGLLPYVRFPTSTGGMGADKVEGGLLVPVSLVLTEAVAAGGMVGWDHCRNAARNGYAADWHGTAYVQRTVGGGCTVYAEAELVLPAGRSSAATSSAGLGVLVEITKNFSLDYEVLRGLNGRALDWTHVFRLAWQW